MLIILTSIFPVAISQTRYPITAQEHIKYWYFRQNLITNFLVIGDEDPYACDVVIDPENKKFGGCGFGIPAHGRYSNQSGYKDYNYSEGAAEMGWYIGVLATELKLLNDHGESWQRTQYELYCALKAYERMDRICEFGAYPWPSEYRCQFPNLNGLFLRDDVDANLFENNKAFATKYPNWDKHIDPTREGLRTTLTATQEPGHNSYPSQDQIAHLFIGFSLVKRCLSDIGAARYYEGHDLVQMAHDYTLQITAELMNNNWLSLLYVPLPPPVISPFHNLSEELVTELNAFGLANAATYITENLDFIDWFPDNPAIGAPQVIGWNEKGFYNGIGNELMWHLWSITNDHAIALILSFAAVGNSWRALLPIPHDITYDALKEYGEDFHMEIYALLNHFLYERNYGSDNISALYPKFEEYIHVAKCDGNYNQPLGDETKTGAPGWMASNRWIRPQTADDGMDEEGNKPGEFNGLDFMLLYNLYWLVGEGHGGLFNTYYANLDILDINNDINQSGSVYLKGQVDLASIISPEPKLNYADVYIRSDTEINLLPGFETENYTDIFLDIAPIEGCNYRIY